MNNTLYFGDNLDILRRYIPDESIDLIYLDPPFNSGKNYNILFKEKNGSKSRAQIKAFEDTWYWDKTAEETYSELIETAPPKLVELLKGFRSFLGTNDMMAYLTMMSIRLIELKKVLKKTGSIYLHCDPTASHYLKILMDAVFIPKNYLNEIVWHYRKWPSGKYTFQRNHDVILFYARSGDKSRTFNQLYMERSPSTLKRFGTAKIVSGHDIDGHRLPSRTEQKESEGVRQDDVWHIGRVPPIKQLFPTEKPKALLEQIILASSNEGNLILDPFCGCGTTITVAQKLNRKWIGIDITHLAISLIKHRLEDMFGDSCKYEIKGEPVDLKGAKELALQDRYQFQWWALGLVKARPVEEKRGADKGIDGIIYFQDSLKDVKKIIIQVKSGNTNPAQIRDLKGVVEREKAQIGVFITLEKPTKPMIKEAVSSGFYESKHFHRKKYPKIQILTVEDLLSGKEIGYPGKENTLKEAERFISKKGEQLKIYRP